MNDARPDGHVRALALLRTKFRTIAPASSGVQNSAPSSPNPSADGLGVRSPSSTQRPTPLGSFCALNLASRARPPSLTMNFTSHHPLFRAQSTGRYRATSDILDTSEQKSQALSRPVSHDPARPLHQDLHFSVGTRKADIQSVRPFGSCRRPVPSVDFSLCFSSLHGPGACAVVCACITRTKDAPPTRVLNKPFETQTRHDAKRLI